MVVSNFSGQWFEKYTGALDCHGSVCSLFFSNIWLAISRHSCGMYRETNGNKTGDVAKEEEHTLAINQNIREEPRKAPIRMGFEQDFKYFAMVHIGSIWIYAFNTLELQYVFCNDMSLN